MPKEALADLLIDTNVLMHFQRLDQLDWLSVAGSKSCTIWLAPVVLRELDRHKVQHKNEKLRKRARDLGSWLASLAIQGGSVELRRGVSLDFIENDAQIDFAAQKLRSDIPDDELIAAGIELTEQLGRPVYVVSNDSGIVVKLRSRPLNCLRLPEVFELPAAADDRDKEINKLRQQLNEQSSREPELRVTLLDDGELKSIMIPVREQRAPPTVETVLSQHPPYVFDPSAQRLDPWEKGIRVFSAPTELAILRYEKARENFLREYEAYVVKHALWRSFVGHMVRLEFEVSNEGRAPANAIDVHITLPECASLWSEMPVEPAAPKPPTRPGEVDRPMVNYGEPIPIPAYRHLMPELNTQPPDGEADLEDDSQTATFGVSALKHGYSKELQPVFMLVRNDFPPSFDIEIEISCNETDAFESVIKVECVLAGTS